MSNSNRLWWIDIVKAISMLGVYLCHSESYSGVTGYTIGTLVHPFYVNAFFFVSGYLFFGKYLSLYSLNKLKIRGGGIFKNGLKNILFRLIIPTIIFSTLFYLPKLFFHDRTISFSIFLFDTLGGISFWFTSAMAVSQIILLSLIFLTKWTSIWIYSLVSIILFLLGWYLNVLRVGNTPDNYFPWFYQTGLEYTLVMALGGIYKKYENRVDQFMRYKFILLIGVAGYLIPMFYAWQNKSKLLLIGLSGYCDWVGFICIMCGIGLVIALCKKIKTKKWLTYIGKNSIVFYFCSGVYPALMGTIAQRMLLENNHLISLFVTIISIAMGMATTYFINQYIPFMIDLRKIKH